MNAFHLVTAGITAASRASRETLTKLGQRLSINGGVEDDGVWEREDVCESLKLARDAEVYDLIQANKRKKETLTKKNRAWKKKDGKK